MPACMQVLQVLTALLPNNPMLHMIDGVVPALPLRVQAARSALRLSSAVRRRSQRGVRASV